MDPRKVPTRRDGRLIIHFDYDCFYASVFEAKNPSLRSLPFAVQQKQIIVTCNYEARRRGLFKLQLIREAKRICPDVIIELGEDISRFRDASKELYNFLKEFSWNGQVERLGFDEVWMDVTDVVEYNLDILNRHDLEHAFFQMRKDDPTSGFPFDASAVAGNVHPKDYTSGPAADDLTLRLRLGSHLAMYLRHQLEQQKGYTSTVGVATNKLLSKLVGTLHKPKGQTTLMPPLETDEHGKSNVLEFMDGHDVGKVPGIGFKLSQKIRKQILKREAEYDFGLVYGGTRENVSVADVRTDPTVDAEMLEKLLGGPGSPHGIGAKIWSLLHGIDDTEVGVVKVVPSQISIEDSYIRLDTMPEVLKELNMLAKSLITRMHIDLLGDDEAGDGSDDSSESRDERSAEPLNTINKRWLAHPKTLRLTTRPRMPIQPDGTRVRSFKRISHSAPLPTFIFNLSMPVYVLAEKLVQEALVSMFHKLHPEKAGWNLSLVNLAVTNMAETAGDSKTANGRNIGNMFRRQEDVLKDFRVTGDGLVEQSETFDLSDQLKFGNTTAQGTARPDEETLPTGILGSTGSDEQLEWDSEDLGGDSFASCQICGMQLPSFAMEAHERFHMLSA